MKLSNKAISASDLTSESLFTLSKLRFLGLRAALKNMLFFPCLLSLGIVQANLTLLSLTRSRGNNSCYTTFDKMGVSKNLLDTPIFIQIIDS